MKAKASQTSAAMVKGVDRNAILKRVLQVSKVHPFSVVEFDDVSESVHTTMNVAEM
ncbi:hypothetical protein [Burkholderia gladioli]|uniref:hypothetical protein n=1 Tax=Burkholderia gladioli TaxID=28095 RepID=UPI001641F51E|nr:hypothetical protein [Burkholderia gladioli]